MSAVVSIIIVNYNREKHINAAIESVLSQTDRELELLIWDDGSTDRSVEIACEYAKRDRRVKVVAASHQGTTKARKEALAQTSGKYLGWVDSDDVLAPTALEETLAILEDSSQTGLVYRDYLNKQTFKRKSARKSLRKSLLGIAACLSLAFSVPLPAAAQQRIIPNRDGTRTIIDRRGNRINIRGGTLSRDGKNLFHSFREFGLDPNQVANFLSNPRIRNILGRINGGNASVINGLIKVTGGNSNLFLMNPSGIIFGPNARINVPGDFSATTATGIGLEGGWFNAFGPNDYINLVGNPNGFKFEGTEAGAIINAADLKVREGNNISLVAGQVITLGTIEAPGGTITIAAVPGTSLVRLTQEGQILSLEFELPTDTDGTPLPIRVLDLPALLTNAPTDLDTGLRVSASGEVELKDSGVAVPNLPGINVVSGDLNVSSAEDLGGKIQVLGDRVGLIGANLDASGTNGGGSVLIGGDYKGEGSVPNALRTFVSSDSTIAVDAVAVGDGGRAIVWADEVTGFYGNISARGGSNTGNGGFAEVSGKQNLIFDGTVDLSASNGNWGTLLLDPTNITISNAPSTPTTVNTALPDIFQNDFSGQDININAATLQGQTGNVVLEATNNISIANGVSLNFSNPSVLVGGPIRFTANADNVGGGNFTMNRNASIITLGRDITISGVNVAVGNIDTSSSIGDGGAITLSSQGGNINTNALNSSAISQQLGDGGVITLSSQGGNINTNALNSSAGASGTAGTIAINSNGGNISIAATDPTTSIDLPLGSAINSNGGNITLTANEINLNGGNNTVSGVDGTLTIQPFTPARPIVLGGASDSGAGTLDLLQTDLGALQNGFSQIFIGRNNSSGEISLAGNITFNDPATLRSPLGAGSINTNGFNLTGSGRVTLQAGDSITLGAFGEFPNPTTISSVSAANPLNIALNAGNSIDVIAGSTINSNGGNITFTANEINLSGSNVLGTNSISGSGGSLTIQPFTPARPIVLGGASDSGAGTLDLLQTDLGALQNGFSQIFIGRNNSSGEISLAGNITFNDPATLRSPLGTGSIDTEGFNLTGSGSVTLQAGDSITLNQGFAQGVPVRSTIISSLGSAPLNVTLNADRDGNGAGAIAMRSGSEIISNGGNIILGGGSNPLGFPAVGTANNIPGILIDGATLDAGAGNISLRGTGSSGSGNGNRGIEIRSGTIQSTSGAITLTGTGGNNGTDENQGILITIPDGSTLNSLVTSSTGAIDLTGTGGDGNSNANYGIEIGSGTIESTNNINLRGQRGTINSNSIIQTQSSSIISGGITTLSGTTNPRSVTTNQGVEGNITLNSSNNDFNSLTITRGNNVTLTDQNGLVLGTSTVSGNLNVTANGDIT